MTLDEFELIDRLSARLKGRLPEGVIGIGDDCAAIPDADGYQLLTCDVAVSGRHFLPGRTPLADVGWRVATANVSDLCACGGAPTHALVSLVVPRDQQPSGLEALYDGLNEAARHYGFQVIGGNVSGGGQLVIDLFLQGRAPRFVSRGGARPGELIAVSGVLGGAAAGQQALAAGDAAPGLKALIGRHLRPHARTDLVPLLQEIAGAAIDISDGLASELHHLALAGGVCLAIESAAIPLHPALTDFAAGSGQSPLDWALGSGEEYELLFTLPAARREVLQDSDVRVIGEVRPGSGVLLDGQPLPPRGWNHLRQQE